MTLALLVDHPAALFLVLLGATTAFTVWAIAAAVWMWLTGQLEDDPDWQYHLIETPTDKE